MLAASGASGFAQQVQLYVPNNTANTMAEFGVNPATGALTPFPTQPTNNQPWEVAVTPNNRFMYVADQGGFVDAFIVAPNGSTSTPPPPVASVAGVPSGIAIDPSGRFLYVSDSSVNSRVFGFSINQTNGVLTPLGSSPVSVAGTPRGMAVDAAGHLYIALSGAGQVAQYSINSSTGALTQIAAPVASGSATFRVAVNPAGTVLYASNLFAGTVTIFTIGGSGALTANGSTTISGGAGGPLGLTVHQNGGFLVVADNNVNSANVRVYSIGAGGALTEVAGSPFSAASQPSGVAFDPSGSFLFIANSASSSVSKFSFNTSTGALSARVDTSTGTSATPMFLLSRPAPPPTTIPAVSTWGLGALGLLLAASSALLLGRGRSAAIR